MCSIPPAEKTPIVARRARSSNRTMASVAPVAPAEVLRAELERLFDLDALRRLSEDLLGLRPDDVCPDAPVSRNGYARALAERAVRDDLHEALADAIVLRDREAETRLRPVYEGRAADDLAPGSVVEGFKILKKTHDEGFGAVYLAAAGDGTQVNLKVLREGRARDRRGLHRFLLAQRALRSVSHPAVQRIVAAGLLADGRPYVAAEHIDGQLLSARIGRAGAMHINEFRPVLQALTEGLDKVHAAGLAHSDLRTDHVVLVRRDGALSGVLVDFGLDRLAGARHGAADAASFLVLLGSARALAPERARLGTPADAHSDVYGLGVLTWEVLTGKGLFASTSIADQVVAHLTQEPEAPSKIAPRGWVTKELDAVVLRALAKEPAGRFDSAGEFFSAVLDAVKGRRTGDIAREEFDARKTALLAAPGDDDKALALELAGNQGIAWADVSAALREAAEAASDVVQKKALRFRVARVLEQEVRDLAAAKAEYEAIAALEGGDELAAAKVKEIRKSTATPAERVELLLEEIEAEALSTEKARLWQEVAHVYERDLHDRENAAVALTEAVTASPADDTLVDELTRLLGDDTAHWNDAVNSLSEAAKERDAQDQLPLYKLAGRWYLERLKRQDFALACFTAAIKLAPSDDEALAGAESVYRKQAQWPELVGTLLKRADARADDATARALRAEAADVLESKLNETVKAREFCEAVLKADPAQATANAVFERLLLRDKDWKGLAALMLRKAEALHGEGRAEALCEVAEVYEDRLEDTAQAAEYFELARAADPRNLGALKGLERLYAREGNTDKLLRTLQAQVEASATPRQRVELHLRIGALLEEEFVDHSRAAEAFEKAAEIDAANDAALRGLGRLYRVLGRWEELATLLERHAAQLPDDDARRTEMLLSAGRVYFDPIGSMDRARRCFERVLEADKVNAAALEGVGRVAGASGDARAAAEAYDQLAAQAKTPAEKVEVLLKVGRILEDKGDRDGAIARYKLALDADPDSAQATARLRALYSARGDAAGAIELLQREIEAADGSNQRAALWAQVAKIYRDRLKDTAKARDAAEKATLLDPTQEEASAILGLLKFDEGDYAEAAKLLQARAARARELGAEEGLPIALKYGEALARSGDKASALEAFRAAQAVAPDDLDALLAVARGTFQAEVWTEARERYRELLDKHATDLEPAVRVVVLQEYAEALSRGGDARKALEALSEAYALDESDTKVIDLSLKLFAEEGRWDEVVRLKRRKIELATSDTERHALNLELGELLAAKLGDRTRAARAYVAALDAQPSDRKVLLRLMQLYSEEKDWGRLVEIILRLTDLVEDRTQLSRYYLTAGQLCEVHLGRPDEAVDYYETALSHDPNLDAALNGLASVLGPKGDWEGLAQSYRKVLGKLPESAPASLRARLHALLGPVYETHLRQPVEAIAAYEKAQELGPEAHDFREKLATLYLSDTKRYQERAVETHRALLARDPMRVASLHALRRVFTEARQPDAAWCLCQALVSIKGAEPEEENFFKKFRTEGPAVAQEKLNDERWGRDLVHPLQDPLLTSVFGLILPAVLKSRGVPLSQYGLAEAQRIDPSADEGQMAQTVHYAAGVLGLKTPGVFVHEADDSGLNFAHTDPPALFLGKTALAGGPPKALAFLAGSRLSYFRNGHYVRQLVPTGTGLRAWLFAAIRAVQPSFPLAGDLTDAVTENVAAIKKHLAGPGIEVLGSLVSKLLAADNALDLKRWTAGVDLTADRAGFLLANDLGMSLAVIRAGGDDSGGVPQADRLRELRTFAVSEGYFRLRRDLGVALATQS